MFLKKLLIVALLISPVTEFSALAQGHGGGGRAGAMAGQNGMGRHGWFAELNLTVEQMNKIRNIRQTRMKAMIELRAELLLKKKELGSLLEAGASDDKIREKNTEIQGVQKNISGIHSEMLIEINKILTPEQRTKFSKQMMEKNR